MQPLGFERAKSRAERFARDREKVGRLLEKAILKAGRHRGSLKKIWDELGIFFRLLKSWISGEYKDISWQTIVLIIAAVIYFVAPIDAIIDPLPFVGYIDDVTVIGFVIASVRKDIEKFLDWEKARGRVKPEQVNTADEA